MTTLYDEMKAKIETAEANATSAAVTSLKNDLATMERLASEMLSWPITEFRSWFTKVGGNHLPWYNAVQAHLTDAPAVVATPVVEAPVATVEVAVLATTEVAPLVTDQVVALTTETIAALATTEVVALTTEQIHAL